MIWFIITDLKWISTKTRPWSQTLDWYWYGTSLVFTVQVLNCTAVNQSAYQYDYKQVTWLVMSQLLPLWSYGLLYNVKVEQPDAQVNYSPQRNFITLWEYWVRRQQTNWPTFPATDTDLIRQEVSSWASYVHRNRPDPDQPQCLNSHVILEKINIELHLNQECKYVGVLTVHQSVVMFVLIPNYRRNTGLIMSSALVSAWWGADVCFS